MREYFRMWLFMLALVAADCSTCSLAAEIELRNPYANVDWRGGDRYRADLHVHTLQSDGCHPLEEVVRAFRDVGFSILAITDHDILEPNFCRLRDVASQLQVDAGAFATERTPYPYPRPATYPADTTWPWNDYGAPSPAELGMLGIEGAELTCTYHVNSFFSDYGVVPPCNESGALLDEELREVARRDGVAVLNHPDTSQPPEWFVKLYRDHAAETLVGMEIAAEDAATMDSYLAVWDRLLAELMPARPVWGFGTSDVHLLESTRFAFTVFLLNDLTTASVRQAMRDGQFYSVVGTQSLNLSRERGQSRDGPEAYDGTYPQLRSIAVDRDAGKISIDASDYDEIVWISEPAQQTTNAGAAWLSGEIVQRGPVFDYADGDVTLGYVRAEVVRRTDNGPIRLLVNPFGLVRTGDTDRREGNCQSERE